MTRMKPWKLALALGLFLGSACASDNPTPDEVNQTTIDIPIEGAVPTLSCEKLVASDKSFSLQDVTGVNESNILDYQTTLLAESSYSSPEKTDHPYSDCVEESRRSGNNTNLKTFTTSECQNLNDYHAVSKSAVDVRRFDNGDEFVTLLSEFDGVLEKIETRHRYEVSSTLSESTYTMIEDSIFNRNTPYFESPDPTAPALGSKTLQLKDEAGMHVPLTVDFNRDFGLEYAVACQFSQAATLNITTEGVEIFDKDLNQQSGQPLLCNKFDLEASGLECVNSSDKE